MTTLVGAIFGAVLGVGLFVAIVGAAGQISVRVDPVGLVEGTGRRMTAGLAIGVLAFVLTWAVSGWIVGGLVAAVIAIAAPQVIADNRRRQTESKRIEAIASWAEMLRDTMGASAGITDAVRASAKVAPEPIAPAVQRLSRRLQHESPVEALHGFAADVAHPLADLVTASLILAASGRSGSLQAELTELATTARQTANMRLRIEVSRARLHSSARVVGIVFATFTLGLTVLQREYVSAFDSATGQVVLAVVAGLMIGGWFVLHRMSAIDDTPGVLRLDTEPAPGAGR